MCVSITCLTDVTELSVNNNPKLLRFNGQRRVDFFSDIEFW